MANNGFIHAGLKVCGVFGLGLLSLSSVADDTEIFNSNPSLGATISAPNVLIILDNTSNWGNGTNPQPFTDEKSALTTVVNALRFKVNVGMMFQAAGSTDGGYVRFAIRPMTDSSGALTTANTALANLVGSMDASNDKANNPTYAQTMAEAYYYFKGLTPRAGFGDIHRDCGASNTNLSYSASMASYGYAYTGCGTASPTNTNQYTDPANSAGVTYISPLSATDSCQKNYIIYISNGPISNNDGNVEAAANNPGYALLRAAGATSAQLATISASPNAETQVNYADEWSRFLYQTDLNSSLAGTQNVITYTINVRPGTTGQGPAHTAMMESMANNGGGRAFSAVTEGDIADALLAIFNEIQSVNSVFASVTLPVSVNVRGTNANQVYIGEFRPDKDSLPLWPGNLKLYKLAVQGGNLVLTDSVTTRTSPDVVGTDGQFNNDAVSFWTHSSTFWSFNTTIGPDGSPTPSSDAPDGPVVEKGGAAQILRDNYASSQSARKVFTCLSCTSAETTLTTSSNTTNFASSNSSLTTSAMQTTFGAASSSELTNIINWVRGTDNAISPGGENNNGLMTDVRASVHADVLHSKPAVINYGRVANSDDDVVIFYASNDGLLHAVKGGYSTTNSTAPGTELWAFVAPEFFPKLKRLRDNTPAVTSVSGLSTHTYNGVLSSGTAVVTSLTTTQTATLSRGMTVTGSGIPANTYVLGVNTTSVTLSQDATASGSQSLTFTPNPKDYFFDGSIGVYVKDVSATSSITGDGAIDGTCASDAAALCDQVLLFVSMRRGGRWLYAFDITVPETPKFKWKVGCPSLTSTVGCTNTSFNELGQTWSEPRVAKVKIGTVDKTALIMGAGYDPAVEDNDPIDASIGRTMGRGIYVLDANDGSVLWRATGGGSVTYTSATKTLTVPGMDYAIPSDIMVIDRDLNGYADRGYVGDTGGNLWRMDFADTDTANWRVNKLASVGRAQFQADSSLIVAPPTLARLGGATFTADNDVDAATRKFLSAPDVVSASGYDAVLIGSGDREHPFNGYGDTVHPDSTAVQNRYYMFKDKDTSTSYGCNGGLGGTYTVATGLCSASGTDPATLHETQLADQTSTNNLTLGSLGWFISFGPGEKVVGSTTTLGGIAFFNTNIPTPPAAGVCTSNLGQAREYGVNYLTGGATSDRNGSGAIDFATDRYTGIDSGGFIPSPVGIITKIGGKIYQGVISGPNVQTPPGVNIGDRLRTYWRKRID